MMSIQQLVSCIYKQLDGQFVAKYKHLTLRSVFQPIYQNELKIVGLEALVRISNKDGLMIRPDAFFHSNTVKESDQLNVERLSRLIHIQNFGQSRFHAKKLFLNVLPKAAEMLALDRSYYNLLKKTLKQAGVQKQQVVMELVEVDASSEATLHHATRKLGHSGYMLAIDDYGINASTKERAKSVKPHIIKLDRSLLLQYENGDSQKLTQALTLAREINSKTVIEGIETEHQLNLMKKLGFDMYQGYLLAMPQTLEAHQEAKTA